MQRLDYILVSGIIQEIIKKTKILNAFSHDHSPVVSSVLTRNLSLKKGQVDGNSIIHLFKIKIMFNNLRYLLQILTKLNGNLILVIK